MILIGLGIKAQDSLLTIEQCRQQAIEYNKELKNSKYQQQEAVSMQKAARTAYLPSLSAEGNFMHLFDVDDINTPGGFLPTAESPEAAQNGQFNGLSNVWSPGLNLELGDVSLVYGGLSLEQPVYTGGRIRYTNKQADLGVEMSGYGYELKYSEIIEQTDKAFWNVAMIEANLKIAERYVEMLTELEEQMTEMHKLGLTPASEKLRVGVQKNEAELQLLRAKNGLKVSKMYLNQILGKDLRAEILIEYDSSFTPELIDLSQGGKLARENRNEIKLREKQLEMSDYEKKMVRAEYLPQVGVGVQYTGSYIDDFAEDLTFSPMVAVQVSVPLFKWGQGKHRQDAANYKIKQAEMNLSNTNDLISLEVQRVKVQVEEAFEALLIARENMAEAEESLAETKASFDVGINTTTDLLNAQADWQSAKAQLIEAKANYKVLETTWSRVTGRLMPLE